METAAAMKPDLVLMTGDISDDTEILPEALGLVTQLNPPAGVFACLGNHEYFRGLRRIRRIFDRSPIPLLVNAALPLKWRNTDLLVAGIDDPVRLNAGDYAFFKGAVDQALAGAPARDFTLLMSHRPSAFEYTPRAGVDLTLSGHTHGGQIGLAGRSVFEYLGGPGQFLWGEYASGAGRLYTSAGVGHWFPFRLGCPAEAPVLVLGGAPTTASEGR
jgi:predicted MPP superfamily phosphohydrolase